MFYFLFRYTPVAKNLNKVGLFGAGFPGIWQNKYFSCQQ